eukprot:COSAG01_NODE_2850_length_6977_cov_8.906077_8_plen_38_part_01
MRGGMSTVDSGQLGPRRIRRRRPRARVRARARAMRVRD